MSNPFGDAATKPFGVQPVTGGIARCPPLPLQVNILHDYDFGDRSQLSQDVGGTIPANNVGDLIARIDDKGSDPIPLLQSVMDRRPIVDVDAGGAAVASFNNSVLSAVFANAEDPFSVAAFWFLDDNVNDEDHIVAQWGSTGEFSFRIQADSFPPPQPHRHEITIGGGNLNSAFLFDVTALPNGAIATYSSSSPDLQQRYSNFVAGIDTSTGATSIPDNGDTFWIGGNSDDSPPQDDLRGRIARVIVWNTFLDSSLAEVVKAHGTCKYGVSWA